MKKSTLALLTATLLSGSSFAASSAGTLSSDLGSFYKKLQDSPLSLTLISEAATDNKTSNHKINQLNNTNIVYLGYKLSPNDSLTLENRFIFKKVESKEATDEWARQVLSYSRSGLLTQAKHGVDLSAKIEERYLPEAAIRAKNGSYGITRLSATTAQSFKNGFSHAETLHFAINNKRAKTVESYDNYLYLVTTQSYSFTEKLSFTATQEIIRTYGNDYTTVTISDGEASTNNTDETLDLSFSLDYQINAQIGVGFGLGGINLMSAHDKELINPDMLKGMDYSVNAVISAF